jgi:hypothetical protein
VGWGWEFLFALFGPVIGLLLALAAAPVVICAFCVRNPGSGLTLSVIALVLSVLAVLMSIFMWMELLSGEVNYADPVLLFYEIIAGIEALVLLASLLGVARRSIIRRRMA